MIVVTDNLLALLSAGSTRTYPNFAFNDYTMQSSEDQLLDKSACSLAPGLWPREDLTDVLLFLPQKHNFWRRA